MVSIAPKEFVTVSYSKFNSDKSVMRSWSEASQANAMEGNTTGINFFTFACNKDSRTNIIPTTNYKYQQLTENGNFEAAEAALTSRFEIIA